MLTVSILARDKIAYFIVSCYLSASEAMSKCIRFFLWNADA